MTRLDGKPLLLIVDDDPDARALLTAASDREGMASVSAQNGDAALTMADSIGPDLILMDAVMPGMSGFDACRTIKTRAHLAHIPVIFMTGLAETEHVVRGFSAGGVDYVTKPVVLDELFARIRVHLSNARAAQSARAALDAVGRSLLTTDDKGLPLWCTPQASSLLSGLGGDATPGKAAAPPALAARIADMIARGQHGAAKLTVGGQEVELSYLGGAQTSMQGGEHYFRIAQVAPEREQDVLRSALGLTAREADVLLWVSRGKSNRDASLILNISPRTVNKHLEQIFEKLGVENRAAAAVVAARIIAAYS